MKRGVSIAVLLVLLSGVLVPLALASSTSVPACCRAGGQHHCMGMAAPDGFRSLASACPHHVAPAVTSGVTAQVTAVSSVVIFARENKVVAPQAPEPTAVAFGNDQKRGPPLV